MELPIRFCATVDGVRVAYATLGRGPALVYPAPWVTHWEVAWRSFPEYRAFFSALAREHSVILFDRWGCGLSDRERTDFSLDAEVRTIAAVADHLALSRFALLGVSAGGPPAVAYAAQYPDRITHLALFGTWYRLPAEIVELWQALTHVVRAHWGIASRTLADLFMPGVDADQLELLAAHQRQAATAEMAIRLALGELDWDLGPLAPCVRAPALVAHREGDKMLPVALARDLAARIPGARLLILDGDQHVPMRGDVGALLESIGAFLDEPAVPAADAVAVPTPDGLTGREIEVLRLMAAGRTNQEIADQLVISLNTVYRHASHIFTKANASNRAEAVAYAMRHRLVD